MSDYVKGTMASPKASDASEALASPTSKTPSSVRKRRFMITNKRVSTLEAEMKEWMTTMETAFFREKAKWEEENKKLHERISVLEGEKKSLHERVSLLETREEGEIIGTNKEAIKEEITQTLTHRLDEQIEAKKDGWVEVVKKNLKQETKMDAQKEEATIVQTMIEEEKMRHARRLNIRVTGIVEVTGSTPENDGKTLCKKLGYKEEEALPFAKAWRVGKDLNKKRALILQFPNEESRSIFIRKRMILRGITGPPIYLDDDLTKMQVDHRRACMPQVHQARKEGKKATYRDGRVIIDGKTIA